MKINRRKLKKLFTRKRQAELLKEGKKGCSVCGKVLDTKRFQKQNTRSGFRSACKYCRHVEVTTNNGLGLTLTEEDYYNKIDQDEPSERDYVKSLMRNHKLTFKEAVELKNKSSCEICGKTSEEEGKRLAVDHCHESGKVRGVLCQFCNTGLGLFRDSIDKLGKAISYLSNWKEGH